MSMVVPVGVAGWGIREGTAALVWSVAGLTVADGVAVSVAYGLIVLVGTLPGVLVLLSPDRRVSTVESAGGGRRSSRWTRRP